ncbi:hypothetical protein TBR22_A11980 [Luteitalea sp. TBR-22]|uniref:gas vesicle protein n=1 Tax=Luteitalea sp. TBR-22 TaxID=2802971 RepID=UPI001AF6EA9C|nr:gas vesicle protein GvpJ [Luteitalea sp. TBR-22]BCS31994.1 hypothetical protein TBR22_A11980 [Luteitalea sp. TBR-22]
MDLTPRSTGLVEVLDRVLDKGLFVGGDVKISLAEVELLTIRVRLIVCSLDKAQAMGLDWWTYDRHLAPGRVTARETEELREEVRRLETRLQELAATATPPTTARTPARRAAASKPSSSRRRRQQE